MDLYMILSMSEDVISATSLWKLKIAEFLLCQIQFRKKQNCWNIKVLSHEENIYDLFGGCYIHGHVINIIITAQIQPGQTPITQLGPFYTV